MDLQLWLAAVPGGLAFGGVIWLTLWLRHSRRDITSRLGAPTVLTDDTRHQGFVVLQGRLEVTDGPCRRLLDGADAAAETVTAAPGHGAGHWYPTREAHCRADGLVLRQGEQSVALEAPVEVLRGSSEASTKRRLERHSPEVHRRALAAAPALLQRPVDTRALAHRDRVRAVGYLSQRPSALGNESYRSSAHRWVLEGCEQAEQERILLAHLGPSPRLLLARPALIAAALATALIALTALVGGGWTARAAQARTWSLDDLPDRQCRWSFDCAVFGRCTAATPLQPGCYAHDDESCRRSRNCRLLGQCHAEAGWCWARRVDPQPPLMSVDEFLKSLPPFTISVDDHAVVGGLGDLVVDGVERPPRAPSVALNPPQVRGSLSAEIVRRIVRRHINEVKYCYQKELCAWPTLHGDLVVQFSIAGTGQVVASKVQRSTLSNTPVETCVAQAARRWLFPKPKGGGIVVVSYPFTFGS